MADQYDNLSDDELNQAILAKAKAQGAQINSGAAPAVNLDALPDDQLDKLVAEKMKGASSSSLPKYDPMGGLESALYGAGQGFTFGHLPQIAGALSSGSVSGPDYEKAKAVTRANLANAHNTNPALEFLGELGGTALNPVSIASAGLGELDPAGLAVMNGGAQGFLQNPGGDVSADQLGQRIHNAKIGGLAGGVIGSASGALSDALRDAADRQAFSALGPQKRQVVDAREKGYLEPLGRAVLDDGIIGNVPRGKETLLDRAIDQKNVYGAQKGAIIDELENLQNKYASKFGQSPSIQPGAPQNTGSVIPGQKILVDQNGGAQLPSPQSSMQGAGPTNMQSGGPAKAGVDLSAIRDDLRKKLSLNPDLADAKSRASKLDDFLSNIAGGADSMGVKRADTLKTDTGQFVNWMRKNSMGAEPEKQAFNKELYRALNKGVDDAAEVLAKEFNPDLLPQFQKAKSGYGKMASAENILDNRVNSDIANRMISPSDYGAMIGAGVGAESGGYGAKKSVETAAIAGALNNFMRQYGSQISAKQMDNLSKVLQSNKLLQSAIVAPVSSAGPIMDRQSQLRLKALGE